MVLVAYEAIFWQISSFFKKIATWFKAAATLFSYRREDLAIS